MEDNVGGQALPRLLAVLQEGKNEVTQKSKLLVLKVLRLSCMPSKAMRALLLNNDILDIAAALMPRSYETLGSSEATNQEEEKESEAVKEETGNEPSGGHESSDTALYNEVLVLINVVLPGEGVGGRISVAEKKQPVQAASEEEGVGEALRHKLADKFMPKLLQLFEWHEHAGENSRTLSLSIMLKTATLFD